MTRSAPFIPCFERGLIDGQDESVKSCRGCGRRRAAAGAATINRQLKHK
jgi:hypothetical protein